jgi:hypothetical protein
MTINFEQDARPTVWLIEGVVEYKGNQFAFWYQYDERDGEKLYEFRDGEPSDDFDFQAFEDSCQARLEKSWPIVEALDTAATA